MKRILLLTVVLVLAVCAIFAGTVKDDETATVKLDLNIEKFVTGFANSESNAQKFSAVESGHEFLFVSAANDNPLTLVVPVQDTSESMYYFYDAALDKDTTYKLKAQIDSPLTQQPATGETLSSPATIAYTAKISGNVAAETNFKNGTWVQGTEAVTISSPKAASDASYTDIRANLRGASPVTPYTVVYAGAFKIELAITSGQDLGKKPAAEYKSSITFAVEIV